MRLTPFSLNYFFFTLSFFSLPPKNFLIIFSGKFLTKISEKALWRWKILFLKKNFYITFSLSSDRKTRKLFTFSTLFNTTNRKTARKNVHENFFFFFNFFLPTAPRNRKKLTTYLFFRNSEKKCSKIPLSALKFHFLQITFFPPSSREHTHTLCFTDP